MNIAEVEKLTGMSKQTIRFYEKEGLVSPKRNQENQYREYPGEPRPHARFQESLWDLAPAAR